MEQNNNDNKNRNIIAIMCASILVLSLVITNSYATRNNKSNTTNGDTSSIDTKYVVDNDINIRKGPDLKYRSIAKLKKGDKVDVLYTVGEWSKINYLNTNGYIKNNLLTYIDPKESLTFEKGKSYSIKVNNDDIIDKVIITDKPNTNSKPICSLREGVAVKLLWNDSNYSEVRYNDKIGYVKTRYLKDQDVQEQMDNVVSIAYRNINKSYNYKVSEFKLSNKGLIKYVYKEALYKNISDDIISTGKIIDKDRVKPGDIVAFDTNKDNNPDKFGVYLGNNEFIHASLEYEKVKKDNLSAQPYNGAYHSVIRIIY